MLKLAFATKLPYDRNEGFRTAQYALPFSLLENLRQGQYEMVEYKGEASNQLFSVLEEWEKNLKGCFKRKDMEKDSASPYIF